VTDLVEVVTDPPTVVEVVTAGPPGAPGAPGPPGADSTVPGMSAYELAVADGYVGTVQEWLDSLQGAPGADGAAGAVTVYEQADEPVGAAIGDVWIAP
jgi:hypothetical protein